MKPSFALDTDLIKAAVTVASRAPSLHNSQPWRWVGDQSGLRLYLDKARVVARTDNSGREALISCGVMLDHLRVAMTAAGWHADIERFPDPAVTEHLATVAFSPSQSVTEAQRTRASAILARRTDRLPFFAPAGWRAFEPVLRNALDSDAVQLDIVPDESRPRLAEAAWLIEELRRYDTGYHAELDWWTAPFESFEGVPIAALPSVAEADRVGVNRAFPHTAHATRRAAVGYDQSRILVLSTPPDDQASRSFARGAVACGEALSTVLLEATMVGYATCPVTHLTELAEGRAIVTNLLEHPAVPQVLIRIGQVPTADQLPPATGRRPVEDILSFDQ